MNFIEQTETWGEFQAKIPGRGKYWLLNFANEHGNLSTALLIKQKLPLNKCWLWCPRGPIMENYEDEIAWHNFLKEARVIALQEKAIFLRIEPPLTAELAIKWPQSFKKAHDHYLPQTTRVINLEQQEEEILAQMKPKGRYNIKLAAKKGVEVTKSRDISKDIGDFYDLLRQTTGRDGFAGHNEAYYKNMLEILKKENMAELFLAKFAGRTVAGIITTFYKDTATYYFGASGNEYRNLMAPYLLQWEAIKEAKTRGCKYYDLLGIAPEGSKKSHPWHGITEFKNKFGGREVHFEPAMEHVFNPLWFNGMRAYKKLKF